MQRLVLNKNEERRVRAGHLWIFSNEVDTARSPLKAFSPGQCALVEDSRGRALGTAYVNPSTLIAARVICAPGELPDRDMIARRLAAADALRRSLYPEPWYRMCYSEGDMLPGLVIDRYGSDFCVQIGTAGMELFRDDIVALLKEEYGASSVFIKNSIRSRELEGLPTEDIAVFGSVPDPIAVRENGCLYETSLTGGQKTGWFYDQRENRAAIRPFCSGARVLDAFCYVGSFGAYAAANGAREVVLADASRSALEYAQRNTERAFAAAGAAPCAATLAGDAFETLAGLAADGERFDVVCVDPPAFIKRSKDRQRGLEAYAAVNGLAVRLLAKGGILVTASCSQHLEAGELYAAAARAAARKRRVLQCIRRGGQAADHPAHPSMPETTYLKSFMFREINV
ncbi:MAG: class I SAM-dependent rRNA methyltransferase [Mailhella sp.]|nr:class I SAM-dependent rRNA methyltransferase [Mailhella sp.]